MSSTLEPERDAATDPASAISAAALVAADAAPRSTPDGAALASVASPSGTDAGLQPLALIGRGGSSDVWLGRDVVTDAHFAVKLVRPELAHDATACARVAHEARILSTLDHPNVVGFRGTRTLDDGRLALLLEYVDGEPLGDLLAREGALPPPRAARILLDVARGLAHAHAAGIVHGDVTDCNVLVEHGTGRAVLVDFGVARPAGEPPPEDGLAGTPAFMAPEQIDGRPLDARSDLYSLALVGWTLLAGVSPWDGQPLDVVLHRQRFVLPPSARTIRDDVPRPLAEALDRALRKDPRARWESVQAFIDAIERPASPRVGGALEEGPEAHGDADAMDAGGDDAEEGEASPPTRLVRVLAGAAVVGSVLFALAWSAPRIAPYRTEKLVDRIVATVEPALAGAPTAQRLALRVLGRERSEELAALPTAPEVIEASLTPLHPSLLPLPALDTTLARGDSHDCRVLPDGAARCAGDNARGQLGIGRRPSPRATTTRMAGRVAGGHAWRTIGVGATHSCALDAEGRAWCWGANTLGQLGTGTGGRDRFAPAPVSGDLRFAALAVGARHACALERTGRIWCWGSNLDAQIGDGSIAGRLRPVPIATEQRFVSLAVGADIGCALTVAGDAWCWGSGATGVRAIDASPATLLPARVDAPVRFVRLELGGERPCGVTDGGRRWCWGGRYGRTALPQI